MGPKVTKAGSGTQSMTCAGMTQNTPVSPNVHVDAPSTMPQVAVAVVGLASTPNDGYSKMEAWVAGEVARDWTGPVEPKRAVGAQTED